MRRDEFSFVPVLKLTIMGNHAPTLKSVDDSIRRRFNVIPFTQKPKHVDGDLPIKLQAEWPSILRWAIEGCLDWQANGLIRPACILEATEEYLSNQDMFGQWLEEECVCDPSNEYRKAASSELLASYCDFAKRYGEPQITNKDLTERLKNKGCKKVGRVPTQDGRRVRGFSGIELRRKNTNQNAEPNPYF
jgi:putative DNA primase/helicase